jgi:hypothetical protein
VTADGQKSIVECFECGLGTDLNPVSVTASTFQGGLIVYSYASRTLIDDVTFTALEGDLLSGGDFGAMAEGTGLVNDVLTNLTFSVEQSAGVIAYSLSNADTSTVLASGTGELGRSEFELNILT